MLYETKKILELFEGFVQYPYIRADGKQIIGYGHRIGLKEAAERTGGISHMEAQRLLAIDFTKVMNVICKMVQGPPHEIEALGLLAFSVGPGILVNPSGKNGEREKSLAALMAGGSVAKPAKIIADYRKGDKAAVANQFLDWDKVTGPKGKVALQGYTCRRIAERFLFLGEIDNLFDFVDGVFSGRIQRKMITEIQRT